MRKLAHLEIPRLSTEQYHSADKHRIVVILQDVRSAYNVGSIFRTSDAARIELVLLAGITADPTNKAVRKTALGAEEVVPWQRTGEILASIDQLKKKGYVIAALEIADQSTPVWDLDSLSQPLCLIVGNEITGVSQSVLDVADVCVEIPQFGTKQSLNVSVAYGIAVMELVRSRVQL